MNTEKTILLFISLIPFLTNLYVTKYLHDIKENKHCREIDSYILTFYYDFYITSSVILFVSIIGIVLTINKYTDLFKVKYIKNIIDFLTTNNKIVEILSLIFTSGLIKLIHDLRKEQECDKIDHDMATNIFYYCITGIIIGVLNLLNIKLF